MLSGSTFAVEGVIRCENDVWSRWDVADRTAQARGAPVNSPALDQNCGFQLASGLRRHPELCLGRAYGTYTPVIAGVFAVNGGPFNGHCVASRCLTAVYPFWTGFRLR